MPSLVIALVCSLLLVKPLQAEPTGTSLIGDYGLKNRSFNSFRTQLLDALKRHDKKFVEEILANNVETGLGAGAGKIEFNKRWQNLVPSSGFWERMNRALLHGAEYEADSGRVQAPGTVFDDTKLSDSIQAIVWNKNSIMRDGPNDAARVLDHLYNKQLTVLKPDDPSPIHERWVQVKTESGKVGYMKSDDIFSAYDEFAEFKQINGRWKLVFFGVSGL